VLPAQLTVAGTLRVGRHHATRAGLVDTALGLPLARREYATDRQIIHTMAEAMDVAALLNQPVGVLPYGIRKRVEIARALCAEPSLLLLDEPAAGMNEHESRDLAQRISDCRERFGLTVLLVEHDMEFVLGICDHITVLQSGQVIADGPPHAVQRDPAVIAAYLGAEVDDGHHPDAALAHGALAHG
jgi:branched-chain amino acid transport system ATP-binding protein